MIPKITVSTIICAPVSKVWQCWTNPAHIIHWNAASDDWHCPTANSDLRVGGQFLSRMEARDGSNGFDFTGTYTCVYPEMRLAFIMGEDLDSREVEVLFEPTENGTAVIETFQPEDIHPLELQKAGWQAILDRFKKYVEAANC